MSKQSMTTVATTSDAFCSQRAYNECGPLVKPRQQGEPAVTVAPPKKKWSRRLLPPATRKVRPALNVHEPTTTAEVDELFRTEDEALEFRDELMLLRVVVPERRVDDAASDSSSVASAASDATWEDWETVAAPSLELTFKEVLLSGPPFAFPPAKKMPPAPPALRRNTAVQYYDDADDVFFPIDPQRDYLRRTRRSRQSAASRAKRLLSQQQQQQHRLPDVAAF